MLRYEKIILRKNDLGISLYSLKYFGDKYGVRESIFRENVENSTNDQKDIGIQPGLAISSQ